MLPSKCDAVKRRVSAGVISSSVLRGGCGVRQDKAEGRRLIVDH